MKGYYVRYFNSDEIRERMEELKMNETTNEEVSTAIKTMINAPDKYVYFEKQGLVDWSVCEFSIDLRGRKLYFSKENLGYYYTFMYFRKESIYLEWFNRKITLLHDMGFISQNHLKFVQKQDRKNCQSNEEDLMKLITLVHFKSGFIVLAVGYGLALIAFCVKFVWGLAMCV